MAILLAEIVIPMYVRQYIDSNNVQAKYYERGRKNLPVKYCNKALFKSQGILEPDGVNYIWQPFFCMRNKVKKSIDFLVNTATGQRVIANPNKIGKQSRVNINGQGIYNGTIMRHSRNSMMNTIKDQMRQEIMSVKPIKKFPIIITVDIYDLVHDDVFLKGHPWDVGNRIMPYNKAFEDVLKEIVIPDDNLYYVTGPPRPLFIPVDDPSKRRLVYRIYHDARTIIQEHPLYIKQWEEDRDKRNSTQFK